MLLAISGEWGQVRIFAMRISWLAESTMDSLWTHASEGSNLCQLFVGGLKLDESSHDYGNVMGVWWETRVAKGWWSRSAVVKGKYLSRKQIGLMLPDVSTADAATRTTLRDTQEAK